MAAKPGLALLSLLVFAAPSLLAQKGDRKGHKMDDFVPAEAIPPAPVLSVEDALKTFQLPKGYVIEAVVAEPLVEKPVTLKFDGNGRMWVCEMRGYMPDINGKGEEIPQGRIVILEDTDDDGKIDKRTVFLDKLLLPRSIYLLDDGILWADQSALYYQPREGDKPKGKAEVIDPDYAKGGNVEHKANSLIYGLDNWIYSAKSDRRYKKVKGKWVMERTHFRGQWGIDRDDYGRLYHNSNSTLLVGDFLLPNTVFGNSASKMKSGMSARLGSNRVYPIRVNPGVNRGYINERNGFGSNTIDPKTYKLVNATGASGLAIYRDNRLPLPATTAIVTEPCGNLVKAIKIGEGDTSLTGEHPFGESEFLASTDERFRPVNAYSAPDGSIYILDMYHGIIQHKTYVTSYLRKQIMSRKLDGPGYGHGRIYRIRHAAESLRKKPDLEGLSAKDLVKVLAHESGWWRDTAQRLIVERGDISLRQPLELMLANIGNPTAGLHALWCLEGLGLLTTDQIRLLATAGNDKLASSALYSANSLEDFEKADLLPFLSAQNNPGKLPAVYLARFLAETGSSASLDQLVALLKTSGKQKFVREAAVAGLEGRESTFIGVNNGRYTDKDFTKWLDTAIKSRLKKVEPPKIKGEHLASFKRGQDLYQGRAGCIGCHGQEGTGLPNLGPPLDESDWVNGSSERLISIMLHGLMGPITVSGERYAPPAAMPGLAMNPTLNDRDIADIATFARHAWSNRSEPITDSYVKELRQKTKARNGALYTEADFK